MLYNVVLTLKSVDNTQVCHHSNERYRAIRSCGTEELLLVTEADIFRVKRKHDLCVSDDNSLVSGLVIDHIGHVVM